MKSICTKLSAVMIFFVTVAAALVGIINISTVRELSRRNTDEMINLICENNAKELDTRLVRIEQSVELLSQYASQYLTNEEKPLGDRMEKLKEICLSTGSYTVPAISVYFHFYPGHPARSYDFLYIRDPKRRNFVAREADDPSIYRKENGEAAWYYASADSGQACWLEPYQNARFPGYEGTTISSYTVPVFDSNQQLLGVIGMDFSLDLLIDIVKNIQVYETGYAFLTDSSINTVYHPYMAFGEGLEHYEPMLECVKEQMRSAENQNMLYEYSHNGVEKRLNFTVLRNGMRLAVTVPSKEAFSVVYHMIGRMSVLLAVVIVTSMIMIFCIVYTFVRPLMLLDRATTQIINGDMNVTIDYRSQDEIGKLADNFRKMAEHLQEHITYINQLAYRDIMTGVKNKTAYEAAVHQLQMRIENGFTEFGIVMFDLNNLKKVNDSLGHEAGDILIKNASYVICKSFAHSPVFRIGGDEFLVLLENEDYLHYNQCVSQMSQIGEELNRTLSEAEQVSIAYGVACFDPTKDSSYSEVLARADKEMYRCKAKMKRSIRAWTREVPGDEQDHSLPAG